MKPKHILLYTGFTIAVGLTGYFIGNSSSAEQASEPTTTSQSSQETTDQESQEPLETTVAKCAPCECSESKTPLEESCPPLDDYDPDEFDFELGPELPPFPTEAGFFDDEDPEENEHAWNEWLELKDHLEKEYPDGMPELIDPSWQYDLIDQMQLMTEDQVYEVANSLCTSNLHIFEKPLPSGDPDDYTTNTPGGTEDYICRAILINHPEAIERIYYESGAEVPLLELVLKSKQLERDLQAQMDFGVDSYDEKLEQMRADFREYAVGLICEETKRDINARVIADLNMDLSGSVDVISIMCTK